MKALKIVALASVVCALALGGCSSAPKKADSTPVAAPAPAAAAAPVYPACGGDDHCASQSQVCVAGTCAQCRDVAQCGALGPCGRCEAGMCVKMEGCCAMDTDCPAGGRCRGGKCS